VRETVQSRKRKLEDFTRSHAAQASDEPDPAGVVVQSGIEDGVPHDT
jgi:hypothetical protein